MNIIWRILIIFIISVNCIYVLPQDVNSTMLPKMLIIRHQTLATYETIIEGIMRYSQHNQRFQVSHYNGKNNIIDMENFIKTLPDSDYDIIIAIGTFAGKLTKKYVKNKPIIISGLGSPGYSGIIEDWKTSNSNYCVVETKDQTYKALTLIYTMLSFQNVGMMYLDKAPSHLGSFQEMQKFGKTSNVTIISESFDNRDKITRDKLPPEIIDENIRNALDKILPHVDIFYLILSKTFVDHFETIKDKLDQYKTPSIGNSIYFGEGLTIGLTDDNLSKGEHIFNRAIQIVYNRKMPKDFNQNVIPSFIIDYDINAGMAINFVPPMSFFMNKVNIHVGD